jgi:glycosyltransferase involved in cell wall biosynthesis
MYNLVFYCESEVFGGHEKMALAAHHAIRKYDNSIRIQWLVNPRNALLIDSLTSSGAPFAFLRNAPAFSFRRNPFSALWKICCNAVALRHMSPDLILVIQGNISISFDGILAAKMARIKCCSYIPMVYRLSEVKNHRFPAFSDSIWSLLYRAVSSYITIDAEQAVRLRHQNRNASVAVVENYVPGVEPLPRREQIRATLGIPPGKTVLSVIGRIEFTHKCQDWIVQKLKNDPFLADKYVLFVGSGPNQDALSAMLTLETRDRFGIIGWTSDLRGVYAATDVLLIASKVEGVPLVMLEALSYRIPVIGTDINGMRSWLPELWRYSWGDAAGLKRGITNAITAHDSHAWDKIAEHLIYIHDERRFASQFREALTQCCNCRHSLATG